MLAVEYRGYGLSQRNVAPTERGLERDAAAAIAWVKAHPRVDTGRIFLFGTSLGGAVAIHAAHTHHGIAGVIVENAFTSLHEVIIGMAADVLGDWIQRIPATRVCVSLALSCLLTSRWPSIERVPFLRMPMLVLSGLADEVIPASHHEALYRAAEASSSRVLVQVPDGPHVDLWTVGDKAGQEKFFAAVQAFLQQAPPTTAGSPRRRGAAAQGRSQPPVPVEAPR